MCATGSVVLPIGSFSPAGSDLSAGSVVLPIGSCFPTGSILPTGAIAPHNIGYADIKAEENPLYVRGFRRDTAAWL